VKRRLEAAAALVQKTRAQNFQKRHPQKQINWDRQDGSKGNSYSRKGNYQAGAFKGTGMK